MTAPRVYPRCASGLQLRIFGIMDRAGGTIVISPGGKLGMTLEARRAVVSGACLTALVASGYVVAAPGKLRWTMTERARAELARDKARQAGRRRRRAAVAASGTTGDLGA